MSTKIFYINNKNNCIVFNKKIIYIFNKLIYNIRECKCYNIFFNIYTKQKVMKEFIQKYQKVIVGTGAVSVLLICYYQQIVMDILITNCIIQMDKTYIQYRVNY